MKAFSCEIFLPHNGLDRRNSLLEYFQYKKNHITGQTRDSPHQELFFE